MKDNSKRTDQTSLLVLLREDYNRHGRNWALPGFQAVATQRFGNWAHSRQFLPLRFVFSMLHLLFYCLARNVYGIEIPHTAKIGRRLHVSHQSGIVVHPYATIGDDCVIRQNVTIGNAGIERGHVGPEHAPVLGNRIDIGAGAVIIGNVSIGDDVNIGPNSVVVTDIKSNTTVMAPTARRLQRTDEPENLSLPLAGSA